MSTAFGTIRFEPSGLCSVLERTPIFTDLTGTPPHLQEIAHSYGPFKEKYQARYEIVDDILQTESQSDAQGTRKDVNLDNSTPAAATANRKTRTRTT
jgi:hypothetical protein